MGCFGAMASASCRMSEDMPPFLPNVNRSRGRARSTEIYVNRGIGAPLASRTLDRSDYWEVGGTAEPSRFFRSLRHIFADATTIFIEVGMPDPTVISSLLGIAQEGPYVASRQTLAPRGRLFRLEFAETSLSCLAAMSECRATPEFVDHFHVFSGTDERLYWPDAFRRRCPLYVAATVPADEVLAWACSIGLEVEWGQRE